MNDKEVLFGRFLVELELMSNSSCSVALLYHQFLSRLLPREQQAPTCSVFLHDVLLQREVAVG